MARGRESSRNKQHSSSSSSSETEQVFINIKQKHHHKRDSSKSSKSDIECYTNKHKKESCKQEKKHKKDSCSSKSSSKSHKKCKKENSSSSKSEDKDECSLEDMYKYYKYRLVADRELMVAGSSAYICANDTNAESYVQAASVNLNNVSLNYNVDHLYPNSPFYVREAGVYILFFIQTSDQSSQYTFFKNSVEQELTRCGNNAGAGQLVVRNLIKLEDNDAIVIRNSQSSAGSVLTVLGAGGTLPGNDATFLLMKIAPYCAPEKCEWDEECLSRRKKHLFKKLMEKMLCDKELMLKGFNVHGTFYSNDGQFPNGQTINTEGDVVFENFQNVRGLQWNPTGTNPEQIKVLEDGVYKIFGAINNATPAQFTFFINGTNALNNQTQGVNKGATQLSLRTLVELKKNDFITLRNHTSVNSQVVISTKAGGSNPTVNAIVTVFKIAPLCKPDNKECKLNNYHKKSYNKFKSYLLNQRHLQVAGSPSYLSVSSDVNQLVPVNSSWDWNNTITQENIWHKQGKVYATIEKDGIYDIFIDVATNESPQLALFINDVPDMSTVFGRDSGGARCLARQFVKLCRGDVLTVRNFTSNIGTLSSATNAGGSKVGQNALFMLFLLSGHDDGCKSKYWKAKPN